MRILRKCACVHQLALALRYCYVDQQTRPELRGDIMRRMIAYLCLMSLAALLAGCAPEPGQDSPQASEPQYQPADTASQAPNEGQPYPRQASSSQESQA